MIKKPLAIFALLLFVSLTYAAEPFTISEIKVKGLQKLEVGTVYNYLPLKVGDEANDEEISLSIRALFKTGFFNDVSLSREDSTLVVSVVERPSIASVTINGNNTLKTEAIEAGLEQVGLIEGRIFDKAILLNVEEDIQGTYLSLGRYSAVVKTKVEALERNRVAITLDIDEGRAARIKKINIVGVEKLSLESIKDEMTLKEKRGLRWFSRQDQYSKQKLEADLELIKSFYFNQGYHDFEIVASNVEISPNKQNIFISIVINEGEVYVAGETMVEGVSPEKADELAKLVEIQQGAPYSRLIANESRAAIVNAFADEGYAFVDVRIVFNNTPGTNIVTTVFSVNPNQRVYVRRIDITGNLFTRDEVVRRELRQLEGAWYSARAIARSKDRLLRLGIFETVKFETPIVPGTKDQVDLKVVVKERDTGSMLLSAGYSEDDGVLFGIEFEQRNLLGTGKALSMAINNSDSAKVVKLSYTNPFHTEDGVSRTFNFQTRELDSQESDTVEFLMDSSSAGVVYKIPIAETNSLTLGVSYEDLSLRSNSLTPPEILAEIQALPSSKNVIVTLGLSKDSRDDFFFPNKGVAAAASVESSVPGSEVEYFRLNLRGTVFKPLSKSYTLKGGVDLGYGDGYGSTLQLPFYKNYYAGGSKSVRGFSSRSLGPKDSGTTPQPLGGSTRILSSLELLLPPFGSAGSKDKRLGLFIDGGMVYGASEDFDLGQQRYAAGVFFNWYSAVGPFTMSYGAPLKNEPQDDKQRFQISIGTVF